MIYFRILKQAPNSKILSICLEGLAKYNSFTYKLNYILNYKISNNIE